MLRTKYTLLLALALVGQALAQDSGTIKDIVIRGNASIAREAILSAMRSKEGGAFLQGQLAQDEVAVRDLGFFKDVKILSRETEAGSWQLIVEVEEQSTGEFSISAGFSSADNVLGAVSLTEKN